MGTISQLFACAQANLGTPYVFGGKSPQGGFDCSGLVQFCAGQAGLSASAPSEAQWSNGTTHLQRPDTQPGDLVFFDTHDGQASPSHVGICANPGCTQMIDAPHSGAVVRQEAVDGFGDIVGFGRVSGGQGGLGTSTLALAQGDALGPTIFGDCPCWNVKFLGPAGVNVSKNGVTRGGLIILGGLLALLGIFVAFPQLREKADEALGVVAMVK